jgi:hypothetical protein
LSSWSHSCLFLWVIDPRYKTNRQYGDHGMNDVVTE